MSFLATIDMDPHIHLHILDLAAPSDPQQQLNQRIYYLSKTRRFDELLAAAAKLQNNTFPNLSTRKFMFQLRD